MSKVAVAGMKNDIKKKKRWKVVDNSRGGIGTPQETGINNAWCRASWNFAHDRPDKES